MEVLDDHLLNLNKTKNMELTFIIILWAFQVAAFLAAAFTWKSNKNTTQKYFIFFLGFVLLIEILGYTIPLYFSIKSQFVYNIYTIVSFYFYFFWFNLILNKKKLVNLFTTIFTVAIGLSIFYENFFSELWRISLTTGTILILICSILFYYKLLNSNEIFQYQKSQKFWIVTGLLIFYISFLPIQLLQPYLNTNALTYSISLTTLNIILYGFLTISFLCKKKK